MRISRRHKKKVKVVKYWINEKIRAPEVRLITDEGQNIGVIATSDALKMAREKELDLVEVSPKADPPIAKILDYGKFLYQKDKEARKQKAKQKKVEIKGIRLSLRISSHDKEVRLKKAKEFLQEGDKVKIEIILKGRERQYSNMAKDAVRQFIEELNESVPTKVEQDLVFQGGRFAAVVGKK